MDSRVYWIWLAQALGPGSRASGALLDFFGTAQAVFDASPADLKAAGFSADICRRLFWHDTTEARQILNCVLREGDWVLTPEDERYPLGLRRLTDCPPVLYGRGVMPDMNSTPTVGIVGTRAATDSGKREARALAAGLSAAGAIVVSGGATGIDAAVHYGALDGGGITAVVMACPLDADYPAENEELRRSVVERGGVLLSEYPHKVPYRCVFHVRNRLIAGMSHGVCLAQTPARSGARITARLARENGRDVFAMPGAVSGHLYDGCHQEIRQGATLITGALDIIEEYDVRYPDVLDREAAEKVQKRVLDRTVDPENALPPKPVLRKPSKRDKPSKKADPPLTAPVVSVPRAVPLSPPDDVSPQAQQVYGAMTTAPKPVDDLAVETGLPVSELMAALTELELGGFVACTAGRQYCILSE